MTEPLGTWYVTVEKTVRLTTAVRATSETVDEQARFAAIGTDLDDQVWDSVVDSERVVSTQRAEQP